MANFSTSREKPAQATQHETASPGVDADAAGAGDVPASAIAAPDAAPVKCRPIDLIEGAKRQLKELTGYPVDSVAGFAGSGDGWSLTVTVVELSRIPAATDVLAEYVVDLDASGDITAYRRGRRFHRGDVGDME